MFATHRPPGGGERALFDRARHRFTVGVAGAALVLLAAGGLVTSTGSGLAVPDWPLSFGQVFPPMVGGVRFEHGHRLVAAAVGLLTFVLAAWFLRREPRRPVRYLAAAAALAVLAQGILGGVTVLLRLPASVSVLHACLAQAVFCMLVLLAVLTSRRYAVAPPPSRREEAWPSLPALGGGATSLVFLQLVLGAIMRHTGAGLAIPDFPLAFGRLVPAITSPEIAIHYAHRVGALAVAMLVLWTATRVMRRHPARRDLVRPAALAVFLLAVQIALGAVTVLSRLAVLPATAHVVNGALLLATCLTLTLTAARGGPSAAPVRAPRPAEQQA
jgi:cytochrome c oxidase assembly protein subunit 15